MAKAMDVRPLYVERHGVADSEHARLSRLLAELVRRGKAQHGLLAVEWGGSRRVGQRGDGEARRIRTDKGGAGGRRPRGGGTGIGRLGGTAAGGQNHVKRWIGATGVANGDGVAMTPEKSFFVASISKMFVATVVLKMWERGELELDGPIRQYLPGEFVGGIHRLNGVDYTDRITLRHLLTHTSGLADWFEDRPRGGASIVERALQEGDVGLEPDEIATYVREQLRPHFPPLGTDARPQPPRYCNTNFDLLMVVVERIAGAPFEDVLAREVLRPLGLANTTFAGRFKGGAGDGGPGTGDGSGADRGSGTSDGSGADSGSGTGVRKVGAVAGSNEGARAGNVPEAGNAGADAAVWLGEEALNLPRLLRSTRTLNSTAADLFAFMRSLVGGQVFERAETWESMSGQWRRFGFPRDVAAMRAPQWPIAYGMGVMHFEFPPPMSLLMGMPPVVGHTGSTGSWLFYCAELDVYVCGTVSQATGGPVPFRFVPKLLRELRRMGLG